MIPLPRPTWIRTIVPLLLLMMLSSSRATAQTTSPDLETLESLVQQYFAATPSTERPILLTQSQVCALIEELRKLKIHVPRRNQIIRSFPHDQEFFSRFIRQALAQDPTPSFPEDPTDILQRIDLMCISHETLRHFLLLAGRGLAFQPNWMQSGCLFPPLEDATTQELLGQIDEKLADQQQPRRRNYTIEHLTEILREVYPQMTAEPAASASFDSPRR